MKTMLIGLLIVIIFFACSFITFKYFYRRNDATPAFLFKVLSVEGWEASQKTDRLILTAIDTEFIHLATESQLERVLEKFWNNHERFYVLKVNPKKFVGLLVHEQNPGGTNKYYHLYNGYIPLNAVVDARSVEK